MSVNNPLRDPRDPSDAIKARTADHWSENPIAARHAEFHPTHPEFSKGWFEEHSRFRYVEYGRWMRDVAGFDRHRGELLLEVGCGMGTDLLEFARGGAHIIGLDLTYRHLELAARRFSFFGQRGRFLRGDAERLPFPDARFDFVYSNGVLHHTPDTEGAVREIHRVLKPGGGTTILLYHRNSLHYRFQICLHWAAKDLAKRLLGRGGRLRDFRLSEHLAHSTDGVTNPLTRVFTARACRAMARDFTQVRTRIIHLNRGDAWFLKWVPARLMSALERRWGWYVVIEAVK
jgi:ubiquinone/menaquinone biosynthesis C-methylase UbiE